MESEDEHPPQQCTGEGEEFSNQEECHGEEFSNQEECHGEEFSNQEECHGEEFSNQEECHAEEFSNQEECHGLTQEEYCDQSSNMRSEDGIELQSSISVSGDNAGVC